MLETLAMLAIAASGATAGLVVAKNCTRIAPAWRRLNAERRSLAADRVYLITLIETPRPDPFARAVPATGTATSMQPAAPIAIMRPRRAFAAPLRAAA